MISVQPARHDLVDGDVELGRLRQEVGALLEVEEADLPEPGHILVITAGSTGGPRLGMPVDRIVGLVDGPGAFAHGPDAIAERRQIDDRVVSILDPQRLMARAQEHIERSLTRAD